MRRRCAIVWRPRDGAARQRDRSEGGLLVREWMACAKLCRHGGIRGRANREALRTAGRELVFQGHAQVISFIGTKKTSFFFWSQDQGFFHT